MTGLQGRTNAESIESRASKLLCRVRWHSVALLCALWLGHSGVGVAGTVGPVGPIGPVGPVGTVSPTGVQRSQAPHPQREGSVPGAAAAAPPVAASAGNHIEVSGNTAAGIRCASGGSASVHSVDVAGANLQGRTVIVQGRNASDAQASDCVGAPAQRTSPAGQTNSIRIR